MNPRTLPLTPRPLRASLFAALAAAAALVLMTGSPAHAGGTLAAHASPAKVAADYAALRADTLALLTPASVSLPPVAGLVTHELTGRLLADAATRFTVEPHDSLASAVVLRERESVLAAPAGRRLGPVRVSGAAATRVTL